MEIVKITRVAFLGHYEGEMTRIWLKKKKVFENFESFENLKTLWKGITRNDNFIALLLTELETFIKK